MPFVVATYKRAKVSLDYHISLEQHFYSVPYTHVKKEVWVKITEKLIEVFLENERIASHPRSSLTYSFSTIEAHMLPAHKAVKAGLLITSSPRRIPYVVQQKSSLMPS